MLNLVLGFAVLLLFIWFGDVINNITNNALLIPSTVLGIILLFSFLLINYKWLNKKSPQQISPGDSIPNCLKIYEQGLISNLPLLFVPPGVGIITMLSTIAEQWLFLCIIIIGSTVVGVIVAALVTQKIIQWQEKTSGVSNDNNSKLV